MWWRLLYKNTDIKTEWNVICHEFLVYIIVYAAVHALVFFVTVSMWLFFWTKYVSYFQIYSLFIYIHFFKGVHIMIPIHKIWTTKIWDTFGADITTNSYLRCIIIKLVISTYKVYMALSSETSMLNIFNF